MSNDHTTLPGAGGLPLFALPVTGLVDPGSRLAPGGLAGYVVPPQGRRAAGPGPARVEDRVAAARRAAVATGFFAGDSVPSQVDWGQVNKLRADIARQLSSLDPGRDEREAARAYLADLLDEQDRRETDQGRRPLTRPEREQLEQAVMDALFRLGQLQPLVSRDDAEDIHVDGCRALVVRRADGGVERHPSPFATDEELTDWVRHQASQQGKSFAEAAPQVELTLPGGARLAAVAWVTPVPQISIRVHRLRRVTLAALEANQTLTPGQRSLLAAAVRARLSIVVAGEQGAGKTTLLRALCDQIPDDERIGTFETDYELFLHELRPAGTVVAYRERSGTGEYLGGREAGRVTTADNLRAAMRQALLWLIVGEVRGPELLDMLDAMGTSYGSMSTTHGNSVQAAFSRLVSCALRAGPHITTEYAVRALAEAVSLVVVVTNDHRGRRRVSHISSVQYSAEGPAFGTVYAPGSDRTSRARSIEDPLFDQLVEAGFDPGLFAAEVAQ